MPGLSRGFRVLARATPSVHERRTLMKLATLALLGIPFLAPFASMQADDKATTDPAGAGEAVLAFTGGSAYTATGGICVWYPVLLGDLKPDSLFDPMPGAKNDKEHAY